MSDTKELERLLDLFKRFSQLAGIAQQKAVTSVGLPNNTIEWLDKAEEKRAAILALFQRPRAGIDPNTNLLQVLLSHDPTATTTHPNVRRTDAR